jgi:putative tricarboxylic transport membrane protein
MQRLSGLITFFLGACIFWQGRHLSNGSLSEPGPGFFPNLLAAALIILSVSLIVQKEEERLEEQPSSNRSYKKVLVTVGALFGYFLFIELLGFIITSFLLMSCLFIGFGSQKWYKALAEAFFSTGIAYVLFQLLLKSQLPLGVFGF